MIIRKTLAILLVIISVCAIIILATGGSSHAEENPYQLWDEDDISYYKRINATKYDIFYTWKELDGSRCLVFQRNGHMIYKTDEEDIDGSFTIDEDTGVLAIEMSGWTYCPVWHIDFRGSVLTLTSPYGDTINLCKKDWTRRPGNE